MENTLFTGKVYHHFDELPSTNDHALELIALAHKGTAKSKPPEGTVVRADTQTAGRGQYGSRWLTQGGQNLTLSVILYPIWLEISAQFYLSMAVALALRDTLQPLAPAAIKWPNDIYINGRKTAGVLIQNAIGGNGMQSSVVGIGLNVNQSVFPPEIVDKATSLALETGQNFNLDTLQGALFENLERRYLQLRAGQRETIRNEYISNLYRLNETANYALPDGTTFTAIQRGVDEAGRLLLERGRGMEVFEVKGVVFLT
ncbi:MAG: biotin--[acetyl-CoA-carboxylase] ligase [Saprospiraceae bacterium]|nr:biotin--[acetyl-CoA-carboxylase] ligase [Saprospiraceae bacterium]